MKLAKNPAILLFMAQMLVYCQTTDSVCAQNVLARTYTVCLPATWHSSVDAVVDRVAACNFDLAHCTGDGGGLPLKGAVFIVITPAANLPGHSRDVWDIARRANAASESLVGTQGIDLGAGKKCLLVRNLLPFLPVWNEVYGLEIREIVLRAWVQYRDEKEDLQVHRDAIRQIVSSISINKQ